MKNNKTSRLHLIISFFVILCSCSPEQQKIETKQDSISKFSEPHRPQFHFTPPSMWMNDPNGMVYYDGEYHLFYQYHPNSTVWGPMHWGHAVSKDLVHWEHRPIALYPDSLGMIFSGSIVVDENNTSELGTKENPPLVAVYTYHNEKAAKEARGGFQSQALAYSLNKGRSWTKYSRNPVLSIPEMWDFRDPKVMWYEEGQKWIMTLAAGDHISFYSSKNLKDWDYLSDFGANKGAHGGVWECPDLFKLPVDNSKKEKWILLVSINPGAPNGGSGTQYFIGEFDGHKFIIDKEFEKQLNIKNPIPEGRVFADFEKGENWKAEGDAFKPVKNKWLMEQQLKGYLGKDLINTYRNGDSATGRLISPFFTIDTDYINLLVGGGKHPGNLSVNLVVGKMVLRQVTGKNNESLNWVAWDTKELKGKKAHIEIIDSVKGGWGHILVDHIVFSNEPAKQNYEGIWLDNGRDNYAGVTWSDIPKEDGRRIFLGWMSNWSYANDVPTKNWRSAMTFPRTLTLENTLSGLRVVSKPVKEIQNIYASTFEIEQQEVTNSLLISDGKSATFDLNLDLTAMDPGTGYTIELSNKKGEKFLVGFDANMNEFFTDRTNAGRSDFSKDFEGAHWAPRLKAGQDHSIRLLADVASVEFFADGGKTVFTDIFFPNEPLSSIKIFAKNGKVKIKSGKLTDLKSIWAKGK